MKIKVCGLKHPDNINAVAALAPDYMGFICYERSPRFISELPADTLGGLTPMKTAVFVNASVDTVSETVTKYKLGAVQLHGNEDAGYCSKFKGKVEVVKAFGLDENFDFNQLDAYVDVVDYFLFDTKTPIHGGSGKTFDWDILQNYKLNVPFFLSGGLSLDNLPEIAKIKHPQFYGVDLNSRFETEPGLKDITLLQKAFNLLR